jgi:hypothetical protein
VTIRDCTGCITDSSDVLGRTALLAEAASYASNSINLRRDVTIRDCTGCITDSSDVLGRTALLAEAESYASNSINFSIKFLTGGCNLLEIIQITISLSIFHEG